MQEIKPGTDRWQAIAEIAESLHRDGTLTYDRLKDRASCSGAVAQRVIKTLKEAEEPASGADDSALGTRPNATADATTDPWESLWNEDAERLKRRAVQAFQSQMTQQAAMHAAAIRRLQSVQCELQVNLDSALGDVLSYSQSSSDAEIRLVESEKLVAAMHQSLSDMTTRFNQAETDLARTREDARLSAASVELTRAEMVAACARAEAEASHWRQRAEIVEDEAHLLRGAVNDARTRAARLEGELEAGTQANADLRSLLQTLATSQQRTSNAGETRSRAAK